MNMMTDPATIPAPCGTPRLTPTDVGILCAALHLPLPTPDVPFDRILLDAGHTPESACAALRDTTDIAVMIAAAALRGAVRVCPTDPRLAPLPHRRAPVRTPQTAAEAARAPTPATPAVIGPRGSVDRRVVLSVKPNPKRPGSAAHSRYALWREGQTVAAYLAAGGQRSDVSWDTERGLVVLGAPQDADADAE